MMSAKKPDWTCPNCHCMVFGSKPACFKCGAKNPASGHAAPQPQPQPQPQPEKKPDWTCPNCSCMVFGSKPACFKCGTKNPASGPAAPQPQPQPQPEKKPDWTCPNCNCMVFGSKPACFKCGAKNPALGSVVCASQMGVRPGDWNCTKCGDVQFGARTHCRMCGTARPQPGMYPGHWDGADGGENLKLVDVPVGSGEHRAIATRFHATMAGATLKSVKRIQNKQLWRRFTVEREVLAEAGNATCARLFHGTRQTPPESVYNGQEGFDMRFCTSGLWGIASYFAVNASYSHGYSHRTGGARQMFVAQVLVGSTKDYGKSTDSSLRMPPAISGAPGAAGAAVRRYDSVTGHTGGSVVHMVYANNRAYPEYILTYTEP